MKEYKECALEFISAYLLCWIRAIFVKYEPVKRIRTERRLGQQEER